MNPATPGPWPVDPHRGCLDLEPISKGDKVLAITDPEGGYHASIRLTDTNRAELIRRLGGHPDLPTAGRITSHQIATRRNPPPWHTGETPCP